MLGTDRRVAALLRHRFGADDAAWQLTRDLHGRPTLAAQTGLDLSISHAGNCWLLAVSGGGRRIGVDIEAPRPLLRVLALAERYFPASEQALLHRLSPAASGRAFLRLWCAREAILKAHGRGIAFGLSRLTLDLTPTRIALLSCDPELGQAADWRLREFVPQRGMIGMLAWQGPPARVRGGW
ncbi:MAG: 4'-phosphopantetheinyl transferase family protein [Pseudomarimonas sp.]